MSNKLIIIIAAGAFVVLMSIIGLGFFAMWSKVSSLAPQPEESIEEFIEEEEEEEEEEPKEENIEAIGSLFTLEPFIVNLADPGGERFLRVSMDLELINEDYIENMENRLSQIRNAILMILPSKKYEDIRSIEGKTVLRDEIIGQLNTLIKEEIITNIYFTEFVVQ